MQRHLDFGKHLIVLQCETLLDRAIVAYTESLQRETAEIPHLNTASKQASPHCSATLPMGWALKSGASQVRFMPSLNTKFILGEQSGQKADPGSVARAIMRAKNSSDDRLFTSEEYSTQSQIAGLKSDNDKEPVDIERVCQTKLNWKNAHLWLHKQLFWYTLSVMTTITCVICVQTKV